LFIQANIRMTFGFDARRRDFSVFSVAFLCLLRFPSSIGENPCQSVDSIAENAEEQGKDAEGADAQRGAEIFLCFLWLFCAFCVFLPQSVGKNALYGHPSPIFT